MGFLYGCALKLEQIGSIGPRSAFRAYTAADLSAHLHADDLRFYLLGRLPGDRVAAIDSHLKHCKECGDRPVEAVRLVSQFSQPDIAAAFPSRERRGAARFSTHDTTLQLQSITAIALISTRQRGSVAGVCPPASNVARKFP
jgi:anti-sigma factor RsiW